MRERYANGPAGRRAGLVDGLERNVLAQQDAIEALVPRWRRLAQAHARSPFQSPDWLLPWWRHYGSGSRPIVIVWSVGATLVGVAPLVQSVTRRFGRPVRELQFWGVTPTPLRGSVDLVVGKLDGQPSDILARDLVAWLRTEAPSWDLFHYLRLPPGSPSPAVLRGAGFSHVGLTDVLPSDSYVLDLPSDRQGWQGPLGAKARHNIRTVTRGFERSMDGRFELVTDPERVSELVAAIGRHASVRWGHEDLYFRRDARFAAFAGDALRAMFAAGHGYACVARDPEGIEACLVTIHLNRRAVALLIGVAQADRYRPFSLGKVLFQRAIDEAVARDCVSYDFLWANGYKTSFWHAHPERHESGILGRGVIGRAATAYVYLRRVMRARRRRRSPRLGHRPTP